MNLLLDTHVLLWVLAGDPRIPAATRDLIAGADLRHVSAISAYEIAAKSRLGRLPGGIAVLAGWDRALRDLQASDLPLTSSHLIRAGTLTWEHRDPFDRMLVAQAQAEGLVLVTADASIRAYEDVRTVWT